MDVNNQSDEGDHTYVNFEQIPLDLRADMINANNNATMNNHLPEPSASAASEYNLTNDIHHPQNTTTAASYKEFDSTPTNHHILSIDDNLLHHRNNVTTVNATPQHNQSTSTLSAETGGSSSNHIGTDATTSLHQRAMIDEIITQRLSSLQEKESRRNVKEDSNLRKWSHIKYFIPRWRRIPIKGDMVRDLQAIESTFLSWIRTGVALFAICVAVVRLVRTESVATNKVLAKAVGTTFITGGLLIFVYSWIRHMNTLGRMIEGEGKFFVIDGFTPLLFVFFGIVVSTLALLPIFL